jgi:hypothetical protein
VKEQSHKDEMSAAIRGDFQRLRERGVSATLAPPQEPEPATVAPPPAPEQEAALSSDASTAAAAPVEAPDEDVAETPEAPDPVEEVPVAEVEVASAADDDETIAAPRPGWLSRLMGH